MGAYPLLNLDALHSLLHARFAKEGFLSLKDLPLPSCFKDMDKATKRIISAIENKENITIIGDYDVDGVTATTLMRLFFEEIAYPIKSIIPNRELCKEKGIELIITDHHLLPPTIPKAYAIIDQKQDAGLKIDMMAYMELTAIAIIADMMPLQHINRAMVQAGIKALNQSHRPAIRAFKEYSKKEEINAEDIGFFLAPILNSAGRMEDASFAVDFLA